jgi:hypothetical protein
MKHYKWFVATRGSYLPKTWQAVLMYLVYLAYIIWILVYVLINHYSFWPAVFILVPNWVVAALVITIIAQKESK